MIQRIVKGISFEPDVLKALESRKTDNKRTRSKYINNVLRIALKIPKRKR